jgi:hypothetical protein
MWLELINSNYMLGICQPLSNENLHKTESFTLRRAVVRIICGNYGLRKKSREEKQTPHMQ